MRRGLAAILLLVLAPLAVAQQSRDPHLAYVFPAGGQQGSTFTLTVCGQNLDRPTGVHVTGGGVRGVVTDHFKPLNPGAASLINDRLKELRDKRQASRDASNATRPTWTDQDQQAVAALQRRLTKIVRKPSSPALVETVTLQVTIEPDAIPGRRELRLMTADRVTNPMLFFVGTLPEITEKPGRLRDDPRESVPADSYTVTQPCVVNGQIMPGGVDRYKFQARKGQELVIITAARELVPYISDAVPGWFQATATLLDPKGKPILYGDDFQFRPDPVLHVKVPENGEYTLVIHDAIYRGREDFVYRVAIGELPFVTGTFPLGVSAETRAPVQLTGWNLPNYRLTLDTLGKVPGSYQLFDLAPARTGPNAKPTAQPWAFNAIAVDAVADVLEKEPNNATAAAQKVAAPTILNGRIDSPGDVDVFRIEGLAGKPILAEIDARRLGSPVDAAIDILDAAGKQIASGDDCEDKTEGLITHHADPRVPTTMPSDGVAYVRVRDVQAKGGPAYGYRLRVGRIEPDFALRVVPSSVNLKGRAGQTVTVYALRRDGFKGEIDLAIDGAPGLKLSASKIPADKDELKVTITAAGKLPDGPLLLKLRGEATIDGQKATRDAAPAEDMMQAFAYRHLVTAREFVGTTGGRSDVWAERQAAQIVARYAATQLEIPQQRAGRFTQAYAAEREAGAIRVRLAGEADRVAVAAANTRMMEAVLEEAIGPELAVTAPAVLGPTLSDLDEELIPLVILNVNREKLADAMPVIARYVKSGGKELRSNTGRDLAVIVGDKAADYWTNRKTLKVSTR